MKPLIVGEAPNKSGRRTVPGVILSRLRPHSVPRLNLLDEWPGSQGKGSAFPTRKAERAAWALDAADPPERPFILVGTRVALAFGLKRKDYEFLEWTEAHGRRVAVVPHPSGINQWWNSEENQQRADSFLEEAARG